MAHELFISYASADQAVAEAARVRLESIHHLFCWMAPHDVPAGEAWDATNLDALDQSKILVLLVGPDEQTPAGSDREVQRAVRHGINVIPLRVEPALSPEALEQRIDRLAEAARPLLGHPAGAPAPVPDHHLHDEAAIGGWKWLRVAGVAAASVLVVVIALIFGLHLVDGWLDRNDAGLSTSAGRPGGPAPESDRAAAPDFTPAIENPAASAPSDGAPPAGGDQAAAAGSTASAASQDARPVSPGSGGTTTPPAESDRLREPMPSSTIGRFGSDVTPQKPDEDASGRPVDPGAGRASAGTVVIEFTSSFPDGTVEVEVDGVKRWTQQLRIDRTPGVFERLRLQRPTQQFASALMVAPGDHKVTVTVLNAEGEVHDFTSTTLHVEASRSVTLRVRLTRFRNRLQLDGPAA